MPLSVAAEEYLEDLEFRVLPWTKPHGGPSSLETVKVLFGGGESPLEAAVARCLTGAPRNDDVRRLWKLRHNNRSSPVLLVVLYDTSDGVHASLCGATGDPTVLADVPLDRAGRICTAALSEPDRHAALRTLDRLLIGARDQLTAGLVNQGLFATHELREGVPRRPDWEAARAGAHALLPLRGLGLIQALGYGTASRGSAALLLTDGGASRAIAILLDETEVFERPTARHGAVSPVAHAIALAARENLPWVIVLRGSQIRLYPARPNVGVGRKSQGETYTGLDLALLSDADAGYLSLLFAPNALVSGGTADEILAASANFATDLGSRLRERVYRDVVPGLAVAVAKRMNANTEADLSEAYHRTLMILFRLLFLAYAEDRGLLPYGRNPRYDRYAIKTIAKDFSSDLAQEFDPAASAIWDGMTTVWTAVDEGNRGWDVPAYNGGLFSRDPQQSPSGAAIAELRLTDAEFGPALRALLVDAGTDGTHGPVDFRSLSVREFGTIYEGLLESSLSIAPYDLTLKAEKRGSETEIYVPSESAGDVVVVAGQIYFHNSSGARKSTGSYFTKSFAVEHLLDAALEPALDDHLRRVAGHVDAGDDAAASEQFFDFRVADLAMGSGHFLVAAIDRIEARLTAFLAESPVPAVADELLRLSEAARNGLGDQAELVEIDPSTLLRRQIARRCIYGIDLNLMAVELARLAIWIHTFVPGLPMSSLDHGLIQGNSLTGIDTIDEVLETLDPSSGHGTISMFEGPIREALEAARDRLIRVGRTSEATKQEVTQAAEAYRNALDEARDAKAVMDAAVAIRLGDIKRSVNPQEIIDSGNSPTVQARMLELLVTHFPLRFPEVFLRSDPGFDVILGNPPWEKVRWEATPFWAGVSPGLNALPDTARDAKIEQLRQVHPIEAAQEVVESKHREVLQDLFKATFALRGGTHLELAQLILERAIKLLRGHGRLGLVLPRQSMVLAGWKNLRERLVTGYDLKAVLGRNHGEWLFDGVHASYAVVLLAAVPAATPSVRLWAATSPKDVSAATDGTAISLSKDDLATFSETHVIPWIGSALDRRPFDQMRQYPRLASGNGWISGSHDARWDFRGSGPDRSLAERVEADRTFRVLMTAHCDPFALRESAPYKQFVNNMDMLIAKRRGIESIRGDVVVTDQHPLIIVRHPSRSDDSRTLIATALPESGTLHNKGYVHAVMHGRGSSDRQRLALLGLINTITLDWWARRFVDRHVTAPVVNQLPVPGWAPDQIEEAAQITETLLARNGYLRLAGGIEVGVRLPGNSVELLAQLERLAFAGYGLDHDDLELMAADFNLKGFPADLRAALNITAQPAE